MLRVPLFKVQQRAAAAVACFKLGQNQRRGNVSGAQSKHGRVRAVGWRLLGQRSVRFSLASWPAGRPIGRPTTEQHHPNKGAVRAVDRFHRSAHTKALVGSSAARSRRGGRQAGRDCWRVERTAAGASSHRRENPPARTASSCRCWRARRTLRWQREKSDLVCY